MSEQPKAHEWSEVGNAVATAALEAFKARAPEVVRKAAEDLYETVLYDAQDYLVDNVTFNIAARIESAERQARLDRERAQKAEKQNADLRAVVRAGLNAQSVHQGNATDLHVAMIAWAGLAAKALGEGQ